jgi:hypothetical protein
VAVERMRWVLVVGRHARGGRGLLVARHGCCLVTAKAPEEGARSGQATTRRLGQHVTDAGGRRGGEQRLRVGEYGRGWMRGTRGTSVDDGMVGVRVVVGWLGCAGRT